MAKRGRRQKPGQPKPAPPAPVGAPKRRAPLLAWLAGGVLAAALGAYLVYSLGASGAPESAPAGSAGHGRAIAGDPNYVDGTACAGCHQEIAATYAETGMGRSFYRAARETMAHLPAQAAFRHEKSGRHYEIRERDGRYYMERYEHGAGGQKVHVLEKEIHYVMGSGNHARTYLHQYPNGKLIEMPVGWYAEDGGKLGMSPGYDQPAHQGFRREISFDCMGCHNAYPAIEPGADRKGMDPLFPGRLAEGIDCQRCHGPGKPHIDAVAAGKSDKEVRNTILNPAHLGRERQLEVCMQCHLETTSRKLPYSIVRFDRGAFSYRPDEPLADHILHFDHPPGVREDKFEIAHAAYRLRKSACFTQSGTLTCTTCHDPHLARRGEAAEAHYVAACQNCHPPEALARTPDHPPGSRCLDCHMPKRRTDDVVQVVMTDHYIQRHKPSRNLLAPLEEAVEGPGEVYQGEVALYYPPELPPGPESELYLAAAQVIEGSNLDEGTPRLRALLERHEPEEAGFYFTLAEAHWQRDEREESLDWYQQALSRDPRNLVALRNYAVALSRTGRLEASRKTLLQALELAPNDPKTLTNLGDIYVQLGSPVEAVRAAEKALAADPDSPEAWNNLARAHELSGDMAAAVEAARNAVRSKPDYTAGRNTLGNLLAQTGADGEAESHFRAVLAIDPAFAQARYNYALLLAGREDVNGAERQLREAIRLEPELAMAHNNLGNLLAMRGDDAGAERAFRKAVELEPRMVEAQMNLGVALAARNRPAEARRQFEKVIELEPRHDGARFNLAVALAVLGETAQALQHLETLAESRNPEIAEAARQAMEELRGAP